MNTGDDNNKPLLIIGSIVLTAVGIGFLILTKRTSNMKKTSERGRQLIKEFDGLHDGDLQLIGLQPKMCPAGYWTEGYGRLVLDDKGNRISGAENKAKAYQFSKIKTEAQAEIALTEDLAIRESMVNSLQLPLTQGMFDALVSFVYNIGFKNLQTSTLLKLAQVNVANSQIATEFLKWNKSNGVVWAGLTRRREAEARLYFS